MTLPTSLIFISAQPDEIYFHWQVELYLNNFVKKGIPKEQLFALFSILDKPSQFIVDLKKDYPGIQWYKDTRTDKSYQPSIRPHILKVFFKEFPNLGKRVFYHDSDILFYKLPDFSALTEDNIGYVSDTISYVGFNYIKDCCGRYKKEHPNLPELDLLNKMAAAANISVELIKKNDNNSGGAQYLLKNIDTKFWEQVETDSNNLSKVMKDYEKKYLISHHIQKWTADMWAVLWGYWKLGNETKIHPEISFSWAPHKVDDKVGGYTHHNIFHLAGITSEFLKNNPDYFHKGKYNKKNMLDALKKDIHCFDYVNVDNNTWMYIEHAIQYISEKYNIYYGVKKIVQVNNKLNRPFNISPVESATEFIFTLTGKSAHLSGTYRRTDKKYFKKRLWICNENQKIIFYNSDKWVITSTHYECEISKTCGGFLWSVATNKSPHQCDWEV